MKRHSINPVINVGREGNVIFYIVGNEMRIRSYTKPKDPKTPGQLANRRLHAELNRISAQAKELRQFCFKEIPSYKNSHNAFIGLHKQFVRFARLDPEEIYQNIHWSIGTRSGIESISISRNSEQCILKWSPGRLNRASDKYAHGVWVVRNLTQGCWEWNLNAGIRIDGEIILSVKQGSYQDEWLLWLFFYDPINKEFTVDKQIHVPRGTLSVSKSYHESNQTNWDMFACIVEEIIIERVTK